MFIVWWVRYIRLSCHHVCRQSRPDRPSVETGSTTAKWYCCLVGTQEEKEEGKVPLLGAIHAASMYRGLGGPFHPHGRCCDVHCGLLCRRLLHGEKV